jgi:hypothetical protein
MSDLLKAGGFGHLWKRAARQGAQIQACVTPSKRWRRPTLFGGHRSRGLAGESTSYASRSRNPQPALFLNGYVAAFKRIKGSAKIDVASFIHEAGFLSDLLRAPNWTIKVFVCVGHLLIAPVDTGQTTYTYKGSSRANPFSPIRRFCKSCLSARPSDAGKKWSNREFPRCAPGRASRLCSAPRAGA